MKATDDDNGADEDVDNDDDDEYPPTPLGRRPEVRLASASVP